MPYKKWEQIEQQYEALMPVILERLYQEHRTDKAVAAVLDIKPKTLWQWRKRLKCRRVVRLECDPYSTISTHARAADDTTKG